MLHKVGDVFRICQLWLSDVGHSV